MMVMLDNNVLIDALASRKPFDADARSVLRASALGKCSCCFTANSATDIYYVLQKIKGKETAKGTIAQLLRLLPAVSVSGTDCIKALELPIDDFEDSLLAVCAVKIDAECIVSRDKEFLKTNSPVRVISPSELLTELDN